MPDVRNGRPTPAKVAAANASTAISTGPLTAADFAIQTEPTSVRLLMGPHCRRLTGGVR